MGRRSASWVSQVGANAAGYKAMGNMERHKLVCGDIKVKMCRISWLLASYDV